MDEKSIKEIRKTLLNQDSNDDFEGLKDKMKAIELETLIIDKKVGDGKQ